jgi:hypothetical protein
LGVQASERLDNMLAVTKTATKNITVLDKDLDMGLISICISIDAKNLRRLRFFAEKLKNVCPLSDKGLPKQ